MADLICFLLGHKWKPIVRMGLPPASMFRPIAIHVGECTRTHIGYKCKWCGKRDYSGFTP